MARQIVELNQDISSLRLDDGNIGIRSGKLLNRFNGFP